MPQSSFWTSARDRKIELGLARGDTITVIAEAIGTTRNAVIGRSHRLRGTKFPHMNRETAAREARAAQRRVARSERKAVTVALVQAAIKCGQSREAAALAARKAGATLADIGEALGVSKQRIEQIVGNRVSPLVARRESA